MAKRSITTNPLIDQLKSAGGGVGTQRLAGFVGRSSDGKIELYTDLSMASFVEIAEADVVHVIDGEKPSDPSQLFVRQDARVQIRHSTTLKDLAKGGCDCGTPVRTIAQQRNGGGGFDDTEYDCFGRYARCKIKCWLDHMGDPAMQSACEDSCNAAYRLCRSVGGLGGGGLVLY
jgi:hypothetical protein